MHSKLMPENTKKAINDFRELSREAFLQKYGLSEKNKARSTWLIDIETGGAVEFIDAKMIYAAALSIELKISGREAAATIYGGPTGLRDLESLNILESLGLKALKRDKKDFSFEQNRAYEQDNVSTEEQKYSFVLNRPAQAKFRQNVSLAYNDKCAITGEAVRDVLEAAHIKPFASSEKPDNTVNNGLLLRVDLHRLFDKNLLGIDPKTLRIQLHPDLERSSYMAFLKDKKFVFPENKHSHPNEKHLKERWASFQKV